MSTTIQFPPSTMVSGCAESLCSWCSAFRASSVLNHTTWTRFAHTTYSAVKPARSGLMMGSVLGSSSQPITPATARRASSTEANSLYWKAAAGCVVVDFCGTAAGCELTAQLVRPTITPIAAMGAMPLRLPVIIIDSPSPPEVSSVILPYDRRGVASPTYGDRFTAGTGLSHARGQEDGTSPGRPCASGAAGLWTGKRPQPCSSGPSARGPCLPGPRTPRAGRRG